MRLLLDTHVLLWALGDPASLSGDARYAIEDLANGVLASAASAWEISIKRTAGKLDAPEDLASAFRATGIEPLGITVEHALAAGALPLHHRDPFDRMLVAQARAEGLTLVTRDSLLSRYGIAVMEA